LDTKSASFMSPYSSFLSLPGLIPTVSDVVVVTGGLSSSEPYPVPRTSHLRQALTKMASISWTSTKPEKDPLVRSMTGAEERRWVASVSSIEPNVSPGSTKTVGVRLARCWVTFGPVERSSRYFATVTEDR
jgi:hypothetical protein